MCPRIEFFCNGRYQFSTGSKKLFGQLFSRGGECTAFPDCGVKDEEGKCLCHMKVECDKEEE